MRQRMDEILVRFTAGYSFPRLTFRLSAVFWERSVDTSAFFEFFMVFHTRSCSPYGRAAPDLQVNVAIRFPQISPKSRKPHQNSRRQKDGMMPFSDWVPTHIWRHGRLRLKYDGTRAETRFRLSAKRTSQFKSAGASVQSTTCSRGVRISGSNAGYTMFRGSVKGTGYLLHSPFSPSLPFPCVAVCHHISTGLYKI